MQVDGRYLSIHTSRNFSVFIRVIIYTYFEVNFKKFKTDQYKINY